MNLPRIYPVAILGGSIAVFSFLTGCADLYWAATGQPSVFNGYKKKPYVETRSPGLYGLTGWNGGRSEVEGKVGYTLYVGGCRAETVPSNLGWNAGHRILSGELPPGLSFSGEGSEISGTPTERGHWTVKLELYNVQFNGQSLMGLTQELHFHITGSGEVH